MRNQTGIHEFEVISENSSYFHVYRYEKLAVNKLTARVLMFHGGSTTSNMFAISDAVDEDIENEAPGKNSIARHLTDEGIEVYLVDWRGGHVICNQHAGDLPSQWNPTSHSSAWIDSEEFDPAKLTMADCCEDVVLSLEAVLKSRLVRSPRDIPLVLVGHCLGAAMIAGAICGARSITDSDGTPFQEYIDNGIVAGIVCVSVATRFKPADARGLFSRIGTQLQFPDVTAIDPRVEVAPDANGDWTWFGFKRELFGKMQDVGGENAVHRVEQFDKAREQVDGEVKLTRFCDRVSMLYGKQFLEGAFRAGIGKGIHSRRMYDEPLFGQIPMVLYESVGKYVFLGSPAVGPDASSFVDDASNGAPDFENWSKVKSLFLTGASNGEWDPEDFEELARTLESEVGAHVQFEALQNYGHQDIFWAHPEHRAENEDSFDVIREFVHSVVASVET